MIGGRDFCAVVTNVSNVKEGAIIEKSLTPPVDAAPNPEVNYQAFEESVNTHIVGMGDSLGGELDWPRLTEANALLVVPSFTTGTY